MTTLVSTIALWAALGLQNKPVTEQVLKPELTLQEQENAKQNNLDTWVVDEFAFIPPRLITLDLPKRGRCLVWYMIYRVTNKSDKPRSLVPSFIWVDNNGRAYTDVVLPKAQRAIQTLEDPSGPLQHRTLLDSVSIIGDLEPSVDEGVDKTKYGVATWLGNEPDLVSNAHDAIDPKFTSFSIFVVGLSNAYQVVRDETTGTETIRRKTLQLKFSRPGDEFNQNEREVHYEGREWIYR